MKKAIIAFIAGQAMQHVLLGVGMTITYSTNLLAFCAIIGILATVMLLIGSVLASIEMIPGGEDMEEAAPIPDEIKVTNTRIERVEDAKADNLFGKREAAK
jgi:hypothetical protein